MKAVASRVLPLLLLAGAAMGAQGTRPVPNDPFARAAAQNTSHARSRYVNNKTKDFAVDGKGIPEVDFDIGESYAGFLPVSSTQNSSLFFWFFPSTNSEASDEVTIWLNGGPGCSSLNGVMQENGPFLWQPGTYRPVLNPYAWSRLTNMVYVDQPLGTGFSTGPAIDENTNDVAAHFMSWFKNFVDAFELQGRKVFITGESYAGHMIPYIASRMLDANDSTYFNVKGVHILDPMINHNEVMQDAPAAALVNHYRSVLALNQSFVAEINDRAEQCGFTDFLSKALTYPPTSSLPPLPDSHQRNCRLWGEIMTAALEVNPCFNAYHLTDICPQPWNQMGQGFPSRAGGPNNYFNRTDVQRALHVPQPTDYRVCGGFAWKGFGDESPPTALGPLPGVIERTNNTIIGQGWLDYVVLLNGTLATIQNMTWNGAQGFRRPPVEPLLVPRRYRAAALLGVDEAAAGTPDSGTGIVGTAHTERGLTFASAYLAGHALPQYAPAAAYRQLEFLLGRIPSLQGE